MKINELILREEWTPTPEQEKWLGNADRKDPYILARMPGQKPPLSYFKDPDDQAKAKELNVGTSNLNTVKSVVGGKPDEPIFSTSPNNASSNFGTFGTSRGFSGTNQAGKDPGPGTGYTSYKFEPYPDTANQTGSATFNMLMANSGTTNVTATITDECGRKRDQEFEIEVEEYQNANGTLASCPSRIVTGTGSTSGNYAWYTADPKSGGAFLGYGATYDADGLNLSLIHI